ncbi:major facilitator superfamily MFS_1 [Parvibaculum lavamentivorans DS-1]|uniref:Major facilitator superfamily MFS_1 n=1 Tax=Parvibaculum lavamentivorans (strain DS-1 / DSM 13023 / NCIMB 13966) TaxID=402881 RepID=A7HWD6_PARL1|nr:MFS transporter [Parvibaculum lavamentivorans]ABS64219.1 major facilitator superfamily MFS_1 [Parvibaculum lavamentivorans DS-1]
MTNAASKGPADARGAQGPLSRWTLFAFALPAAPISAMGLPLVVHLPPFYAGSLGLGLTVVGTIFMLARFWDVFTDPVLGILSDKFETRWGRRRHWIVLSVPIMLLSVYMIFMPPVAVTAFYLIFWLFVLYVGWTLLTISHMSWGAELTPDYHERSRVQGAREVALVLGMVLVLTLPVLIEQTNPENLAAARVASMGWFVLILLPIAVGLAVWKVPERPTTAPAHVPMRQAIRALVQSRPLQVVLAADLLGGVSGGLVASMFLFLAEDALKLGQYSSLMLLGYFISGVCFIPLILAVSRRLGKHKTAAASAVFNALTVPLILLVPQGNAMMALGVWVLCGVNMAAGPFLFRSLMADVADHDTVITRQQRTGLFYSLLTSTSKVGAAFAIFIAYSLLDSIGFQAGGENSQSVLDSLRAVYVWPACIISAAVAGILWFYPIDEKQQVENRRILEMRGIEAAATAVAMRTGHPSDAQSSGIPAD